MKLLDKIKKLIILLGINIALILVIALIKNRFTDIMFIKSCMLYLATGNFLLGLVIKSSGQKRIVSDRMTRKYFNIGSRKYEEDKLNEEAKYFYNNDSITSYFIGSGAILIILAII